MKKLLFCFVLLCISIVTYSKTYRSPAIDKKLILEKENCVVFNQAFSARYVATVQQKLLDLSSKLEPNEPIYLIMDSPGGSIIAGLDFIAFIKSLPNPVHTLTLYAASMAYITVQMLDKRYIAPQGILMSHRARATISGQLPGELNTMMGFFKQLTDSVSIKVAKRLKMPVSAYESLIINEYWTFGDIAVKNNHADKVITPVCGDTLKGTETVLVRTFFGSAEVVFSKCPLIRYPLKIRFVRGMSKNKTIENIHKMYQKKQPRNQ